MAAPALQQTKFCYRQFDWGDAAAKCGDMDLMIGVVP